MADQKTPRPKTQKEILLGTPSQQPYNPPEGAPGFSERGNPNKAFPERDNRGNQVSFKGDTTKPFSLGLKENDEAIFYYLENVIIMEMG